MKKRPEKELEELANRKTPQFTSAMHDLGLAIAGRGSKDHALHKLARTIGATMSVADMLGRRRLLLEAKALGHSRYLRMVDGHTQQLADNPMFPDVPFEEAIEDIARREPVLARSAREVQELYSARHAFALARSAQTALTERVQGYIAQAIRRGRTVQEARRDIVELGALDDFTQAYAETVYRTNLSTAYTAGRFAMSTDPDVEDLVPAWEYVAIRDSDVRKNHLAAHGLLASPHDPVWETYSPPMGYNCRCSVRLVGRDEAARRGFTGQPIPPSTFSQAHPDEGFGRGRPDRRIYG